ncbi:MAG: XRE family transcriptional regulator [Proteobacteria bacterium]|nr:MAG: XRE family transcriptional regulator [Pseudomonadota bacterium]
MQKDELDPKKQFGLRLRELRLAANLSQEALADLAGLDRTYISGCERGRRNASIEALHKIGCALQLPTSKLLEPPKSFSPEVGE